MNQRKFVFPMPQWVLSHDTQFSNAIFGVFYLCNACSCFLSSHIRDYSTKSANVTFTPLILLQLILILGID